MPGVKRDSSTQGSSGTASKKVKQDKDIKSAQSIKPSKDFKHDKKPFNSSKDYKPEQSYKGTHKYEKPAAPVLQSSAEAHAKQRALVKERKAAKPNADSIARAKKLWERLRLKSHVAKDERRQLVEELFGIITGNVKDFVFKHDSVRVVQCALKYATVEQKKEMARELKGEYRTLAESKYAKFLVAKLLVEDKEIREMIVSEFYGHVRRLINHPEASWILDDTYRQIATPKQKAILLREWYGSEFAIFKSDSTTSASVSADLLSILAGSPEKHKPIMSYTFSLINQLVQKKLTGFTMLHDAMLQYSLAAGPPGESEAGTEFHELLKGDEEGDLLKNLAFTKSGARIVCRALAFSGAKDRKTILKHYRDSVELLANDSNGVNILLAAYEVIDDTVMTAKLIFPNILATQIPNSETRYDSIVSCANNPIARLPLLYPFATDKAKWLVPPHSDAFAILAELRTLRTTTSKKDPEIRNQELVKAASGHDGILLATITNRAAQLVGTPAGCQFITEVLLGAQGDKTPAMTAVATLASGDPRSESHIAISAAGGRMLKTLVLGARFDVSTKMLVPVEPRLGFADVLYGFIKTYLLEWATGASSFVVANLMEDGGFGEKKGVRATLGKQREKLEAAKKEGNQGAGLLVEALDA